MNERESPNPTGQAFENVQVKRWRGEFPYHWDADDLVSRRELLQFAVYTSGALFAGTAVLAGLALADPRAVSAVVPIVKASEVAQGAVHYFDYPSPGQGAVLLRLPSGEFVAYSRKCTHLSCSVYYAADRGRLLCPCHEGVFDIATGEPVAGPPRRRLPQIALQMQGDTIVAVGMKP